MLGARIGRQLAGSFCMLLGQNQKHLVHAMPWRKMSLQSRLELVLLQR